jgi:competence protein ComEC
MRAVAVVFISIFLGFLRTDQRIARYDFPVVKYNLGRVMVYGRIVDETVSFSKGSEPIKYIVVDVDEIEALNKNSVFARDKHFRIPKKLRIKLLNPREVITLGHSTIETYLMPIDSKKFDSDFDFQMHFYFGKIGGIGYRGIVKNVDRPNSSPYRRTLTAKINRFRFAMAERLMSIRRGFSTGIIATIVTGWKNLNNRELLDLINSSGLAHILSISAVHFIVISQLIILLTKNTMYISGKINSKFGVYKISALVSIFVNSAYMMVCGFSLSTVRAYIMNLIDNGSILLDRFNSPLRSLMFTMLLMVSLKPELVLTAGFYMSFLSSMVIIALTDYYYIYRDNSDEQSHNYSIISIDSLKIGFFISLSLE